MISGRPRDGSVGIVAFANSHFVKQMSDHRLIILRFAVNGNHCRCDAGL
jgi:hypothetical protein